jgi:arylsulfatase B
MKEGFGIHAMVHLRFIPITSLMFVLHFVFVHPFAIATEDRPNIIVIIADDLGYGETGMMGNREIPTPHIDALAADGVRCTSGYVTASFCSPSRAGLMTGRYQARFGYDMNPTGPRNLLPEAGLPESETTFVQKLSDAGYATGLVGKWHLGATDAKRPLRKGFQHFYGFLHEGHFYVPGPPYKKVLTMIRDTSLPPGEHVREGNFIRGNYRPMNEPAYDADNPIMQGEKTVVENDYLTDAITDEAIDFINAKANESFCLVVSYNAVHSPLQSLQSDMKELLRIQDVQRRIFAGMLVALDRGVGRLRRAIDDHELERKTMVVFLSDNGGPTEELTSSNAPLRDGKGSLYEGGIRVPMVWLMPGRLPTGQVEKRPVLSLDIAATALELAGLPADESYDGKSILPWIDQPSADSPHDRIYWRMPGGKYALRAGNWKIVRPKQGQPVELYHLAGDVGEANNLAADYPDKLKDLINQWSSLESTMADPIVLPAKKSGTPGKARAKAAQ